MGPDEAVDVDGVRPAMLGDGADRGAVGDVLEALRVMAEQQDRGDLAGRLAEASWRVARTETLVCVVGEFKKGKSALINALLEQDVCPVDDDLSTASVTVVRHDDQPSVSVRRRAEGKLVVERVSPEDVERWVLEHELDRERRSVELVEIGLPHPLLERGIAFVDTPGVGGLNAAHAVATLAFLPSADALIFVTDASAELSEPELGFLGKAVEAGPPVLIAVTKVDMYPEWRRIVALDEAHLRDAGMDYAASPISSVLRSVAHRTADPVIDKESGLPDLLEAIMGTATDGARSRAIASAVAELEPAIAQLREPLVTEVAALEHPDRATAMARHLEAVRARLAALTAADARWSVRLDDEFDGLRSQVAFGFQTRLRERLRVATDELETIDPAQAWQEFSQRFQNDVATVVRGAFVEATDGAARAQASISELLADEDEALLADGSAIRFEVSGLWTDAPGFGGRSRTGLLGTVGLLAGATVFGAQLGTVGIEMLGLLGTLLGAAIVGPAVVGAALVFGGKQVVDERRRQLADRRQAARSFITGFVEDVRFEVDGRLTALLGDLQRQMRARFGDRIGQLQRTNEEAANALERASEQDAADRRERLERLRADLAVLDELEARAKAAAEQPPFEGLAAESPSLSEGPPLPDQSAG